MRFSAVFLAPTLLLRPIGFQHFPMLRQRAVHKWVQIARTLALNGLQQSNPHTGFPKFFNVLRHPVDTLLRIGHGLKKFRDAVCLVN